MDILRKINVDEFADFHLHREEAIQADAGAPANLGPRADARAQPDLRLARDEDRRIEASRIRDDPAFSAIRISPTEGVALEWLALEAIVRRNVADQPSRTRATGRYSAPLAILNLGPSLGSSREKSIASIRCARRATFSAEVASTPRSSCD
jgi:hypothetical protein